MTPRQRNKVGLKLIAYYTILITFVGLLIRLVPEITPMLPFGGLSNMKDAGNVASEQDLLVLVTQMRVPVDMFQDAMSVTFSMLGALILMIPVRWVYLAVGDLEVAEEEPAEQKVGASLLLLPLVVTAIIVIVKFSLALAFALTGIFAGVRYRTSLKNLTDALFIFACMAVGLAAGTQALGVAFALSVFFVFTALALEPMFYERSPGKTDEKET